MSELRKDYLLDRYVIIATDRGKRPHQFKNSPSQKHVGVCFFCPGNEKLTTKTIESIKLDEHEWSIRVFTNKFPAVKLEGNAKIRTDNKYFTFADAVGHHEIIVETPEHNQDFCDLNENHIKEVLKVFNHRIQELSKNEQIKYVSVFKNHGAKAGTSIVHTHSQIIAYNIVPTIIQEKEEKSKAGCPYCEIIEIEKNSFRRVFESDNFVSFAPYASRYPFEINIFPKKHIVRMDQFSDDDLLEMASMLKKILLKLKELEAPYNMYIHYGLDKMHFHIAIEPRLATHAGFELATETIINSMPPEDAAEFYRQ